MLLARTIVASFYGQDGAAAAEEHFVQVFQQKEMPDEMPAFHLTTPTRLIDILVETELVSSKSQVRRLVEQGSIQLNGEKVEDMLLELLPMPPGNEQIIQVGKRRFLKVVS